MPVTLPAPSTLEDVFKMNPGAFGQAQGMIDLGMQQGQQDLRKTQLQNLFDEQNDPLRVEQTRLANETSLAQLPGFQADSAMKQRKNSNEALWNDDAVKAARSEFLAKASDNDLKMIENRAQEMAYSFDPKVRAQGEALLNMHKEMVKERSKQADMGKRRLDEIKESGNQARLTQQQAIDAGKFKKAGSGGKDFWSVLPTLKGARNIHAAILAEHARLRSEDPENPDLMKLEAMAAAVRPQAAAEIATSKPGQINAGEVTGLPTNPTPQIAPLDPRNSNIPSDLPQGTRINPDGTFTLPDGTRIRKKAQ